MNGIGWGPPGIIAHRDLPFPASSRRLAGSRPASRRGAPGKRSVRHGQGNRGTDASPALEVLRRDQRHPALLEERGCHRPPPGGHSGPPRPRGAAGRRGQRARPQARLARSRGRADGVPPGAHGHGLREEQGQGPRLRDRPPRPGAPRQLPDGQRDDPRGGQRHRGGHVPGDHGGPGTRARPPRVPLHGGRGDRPDRGEQLAARLAAEPDAPQPRFRGRGGALRRLLGRARFYRHVAGRVRPRPVGDDPRLGQGRRPEGRALGPRDPPGPRERAQDPRARAPRPRGARRARRPHGGRQQAQRDPARGRGDRVPSRRSAGRGAGVDRGPAGSGRVRAGVHRPRCARVDRARRRRAGGGPQRRPAAPRAAGAGSRPPRCPEGEPRHPRPRRDLHQPGDPQDRRPGGDGADQPAQLGRSRRSRRRCRWCGPSSS